MAKTELVRQSTRYRPYPEYKDSGVEWFGRTPTLWRLLRIKFILQKNDGGVWGDDSIEGGTLVLRSTEINSDGSWNIHSPAYRKLSTEESEKALLLEGDLLITKSSGSELHIGKTALVDRYVAELKCCFSNFMQRLRPKGFANPKILFYFFNSYIAREQLNFLSNTTTGLANLNAGLIGEVLFMDAPIMEQKAIIAFLDRETEKIDRIIAKREELIELLKEKRQAVITQAVTKGLDPEVPMKESGIPWLGKIPKHWSLGPTKFFYSIQLGKMLQNQSDGLGHIQVPYLKAIHVNWGQVDTEELPEMWASPDDIGKYEVQKGDLLVCEGGEAGRAAILGNIPNPCIIQNALHRVRHPHPASLKYLMYLLKTMSSKTWFDVICNKATIAHFTGEKFAESMIPMPSINEQKIIVAHIETKIGHVDKLIQKNREFIDLLKEKHQVLISAAVTGKIDIRGEL